MAPGGEELHQVMELANVTTHRHGDFEPLHVRIVDDDLLHLV